MGTKYPSWNKFAFTNQDSCAGKCQRVDLICKAVYKRVCMHQNSLTCGGSGPRLAAAADAAVFLLFRLARKSSRSFHNGLDLNRVILFLLFSLRKVAATWAMTVAARGRSKTTWTRFRTLWYPPSNKPLNNINNIYLEKSKYWHVRASHYVDRKNP